MPDLPDAPADLFPESIRCCDDSAEHQQSNYPGGHVDPVCQCRTVFAHGYFSTKPEAIILATVLLFNREGLGTISES